MSKEDKQDFQNWENQHLDIPVKKLPDWTGWEKIFGEIPAAYYEKVIIKKTGYIYIIRSETGEYKIGLTKNLKTDGARLKSFSVQSPLEIELIHNFYADDTKQAEIKLHEKYAAKRVKGEWFALNQEDIDEIKNIKEYTEDNFIKNE